MATQQLETTELADLLSRPGVHRNLCEGTLVEHSIRRGETKLASNGALCGYTGKHTGRSPKDKFVVKDSSNEGLVHWGPVNQPFEPARFDALYGRMLDYLRSRDELFIQDLFAGADSTYRLPIRVINELAWHNLFVRQLFVRPAQGELGTQEPQIWDAIRFGSVLENVVIDPETHIPSYDDGSLTENTRAAYPVDFIQNAVIPGIGGHPKHVIFLTADAFGVLPPVSRLTPEQAMYHFLSGYTAKVAGTEAGMGKEPQATFSTCFGAPFLPLRPRFYAELLGSRLKQHNAQCWLVNTGWHKGPYG